MDTARMKQEVTERIASVAIARMINELGYTGYSDAVLANTYRTTSIDDAITLTALEYANSLIS
jgi:hypothetical protein